jgi:Holliday junction resolvasome RuvABC endonuclease subunit
MIKKSPEKGTRSKLFPTLSPNDVCIGIDQGYEHLGICVVTGRNRVLFTQTLHFSDAQTKKQKRKLLVATITDLLPFRPALIVTEFAREFSTDKKTGKLFHNADVIASLKEITQCLVDAFEIPVVSADTRSVKHHILSNPNISKEETARLVQLLTGNGAVDEHAADAYCFGMAAYNRNIKLLIAE